MHHFAKRLKRKAFKKNIEIKNAFNALIQPYKEMPSTYDSGKDSESRINAHDLFSYYTADIIKEELIFVR